EFAEPAEWTDAQVRLLNILRRERRVVRDLVYDLLILFRSQRIAFFQRRCVISMGEDAGFLRYLLDCEILQIRLQKVVIPRGGYVGGQKEFCAIIRSPVCKRNGRQQNNSVQIDFMPLLQHASQLSRAGSAVTFADQKL